MSRRPGRDLEDYRHKRMAGRTPEPFGAGVQRPRLFVVQQHAARRLHHDFRLEWEGVLLSWALPRGPSLDPSVKRLAVQVEDHPVEYADFEGVIPEGNYGAGAVIVWDRGRWIPQEDVAEGLAKGKLLFDLEGYKLRGRWTLVRTRRAGKPPGKEWLLIKKRDAYAVSESPDPGGAVSDESVLSGLTLTELREGSKRAEHIRRELVRVGAPRRPVDAAKVRPMLAERRERPFSRRGWVFEAKYDGYRCIAGVQEGRARLFTRRGAETTRGFPEIARALATLPYPALVLDGEIVATDREGRPDFQRLQRRARLRRSRDIERASLESPASFFVFDLLAFDEFDLRPLALVERKRLLEQLLPRRGPLRYSPHFAERGEAVYAEITRLGLEGIVAKQADAPYEMRRSAAWQKVRALASDDFVIVGYTAPRGARAGFGALHLAAWADGRLVYVGRVGSGFPERELARLREELDALRRPDPPCEVPRLERRTSRWVEPRLVCEVRYAEITADGLLRQPAFLRKRDDKAPEECLHPTLPPHDAELPEPQPQSAGERSREVPFTNLDKTFWPEAGLTKGDLVEYYRGIAPWLLPYLRDRPLVLTRYPDGITGKSFFQKHAPAWIPSWVRTERLWSEHARREIRYFVCDELDQLLYVVNLGTIPLHVWSSRTATLQRPDWCILDLDPKDAPFQHVIRVAREIRALCDRIRLPCFVKSSGASGLHVLVPLAQQVTYQQSRALAGILAQAVVEALPEIATLARALRARRGRVYVDTLQNGHGRLLVAPFSVRPLPGAPVSMPLRWREVSPRLEIARHTLHTAARRMRRLDHDPLRPVLDAKPDLLGALERLRQMAESEGAPRPQEEGGKS